MDFFANIAIFLVNFYFFFIYKGVKFIKPQFECKCKIPNNENTYTLFLGTYAINMDIAIIRLDGEIFSI